MATGGAPARTQEDIVPPAPTPLGFRVSGVLLAVAAAVTLQVVLVGPAGVDLRVQAPGGDAGPLGFGATTLVTAGVGLAAWILAEVLERTVPGRARTIWTLVALAVFGISVVVVALMDVPAGSAWGLVALHACVAAVLIPSIQAGMD